MKLTSIDIKKNIEFILTWTFLNFAFNLIALWFSKLLRSSEFNYLTNISNEFVKPLLIQSALYTIIFILSTYFIKNKKLKYYSFTLIQIVIFHLIFLLNIKFTNGFHFESTMSNWGLKYLSYNWQYLGEIANIYLPINGMFEGGMFIPMKAGVFYFQWIFLVLTYFGSLTWLSLKANNFIFNSTADLVDKVIEIQE